LGFATVFYCLKFETSLFVASYDSQGHGGDIRPRLHTGDELASEFTSLTSTLHRHHGKRPIVVDVFTVPLLRNGLHNTGVILLLGADYIENTASSILVYPSNELFTKNLSSLDLIYLAMDVHVTISYFSHFSITILICVN
jgi:hypothetical protein